ncbi:SUKH-3 domain-containing protein [Actinoplanes derwentensis]|uniref:SUKH-3 immunity protein n=1 Tax=Actinoplanes derwentensis TaxID=113562 RepID=A0A1H1Z9J0_9ACTN|nr:SUKH-3 domain-containing protein [Actinoplanes derwentensis]GID82323.1 hypothetical protein Ade03nite_12470 [Actinoplanes derwentensis]SDT30340.1 SUKH-3 immunity protein [Actinoplanes derwentensis]
MITRAEADAIAATWARFHTLTGQERRALVQEFDLGFLVTLTAPPPVGPGSPPVEIGGGAQIIDRETGRLSTWPNLPFDTVQQMYRNNRDDIVGPPRTADPEVQLRRDIHRRVAPSIAAHATVGGRVYISRGAKGDQKLNHHRLVLERLAEQTPHEQVRGHERHAELIACSDALHDVDRRRALDGLPPVTLDEARASLRGSQFQTFQIHAPGDPLGGKANDPCETCVYVLTQLALLPWASSGALHEFRAEPRPNPVPAVFSDTAASELLNGGWWPDAPRELVAEMMQGTLEEDILPVAGQEFRHESFAAFAEAMGYTGLVGASRRAPGVSQRSRLFEIHPGTAAHTADLLHEFGQVIGARLLPLGRVNSESVLAIDEHGRVFDLDQAGEWFVADTYLEALETLTSGRRTYRVRDDGTWS